MKNAQNKYQILTYDVNSTYAKLAPQGGDSLTFMTGVIMSVHFLRPPNMLTKFF